MVVAKEFSSAWAVSFEVTVIHRALIDLYHVERSITTSELTTLGFKIAYTRIKLLIIT